VPCPASPDSDSFRPLAVDGVEMLDSKRRLASFLATLCVIGAALLFLLTVETDTAEEVGLRAWLAAALVKASLWGLLGGLIGWSCGYVLGDLLAGQSSKWHDAVKAGERRSRRRRRRSGGRVRRSCDVNRAA
jgi:hypothetical protein